MTTKNKTPMYIRRSRGGSTRPVHEPEVRRAALRRAGLLRRPVHEPEVLRALARNRLIPLRGFATAVGRLGLGRAQLLLDLGSKLEQLARSYYGEQSPQISYSVGSLGGWTLKFDCPPYSRRDTWMWGFNGDFNACLTAQAIAAPNTNIFNQTAPPVIAPGNWREIAYFEYTHCPGFPAVDPPTGTIQDCAAVGSPRGATMAVYTRPAGPDIAQPQAAVATMAPIFYPFGEEFDPMKLPIGQFVPLRKPLPGYANRLALKSRAKAMPQSLRPPPAPPAKPIPVEFQEPRKKERKFVLSPLSTHPAAVIMNIATESADFMNALYYAIPVALRPHWPNGKLKRLSFPDKSLEVFRHWKHIDIAKAYQNWLQNQIGDAIAGTKGKLSGKANRAAGLATGLRI